VVEVDQTEMPFRADDNPDTPRKTGKIIVIGAVEVIDRATGKAQRPKALGQKYLDTLSGRIRLAAIPSNHAPNIHAFVRANIAPGATLVTDGHASYSGIPGYRHDPRVIGSMAAHIPLKWIHRVFALLKRWSLGTYHGLRRRHIDAYLNEFVFRYNRRFYRHVSFETVLGLAVHRSPLSYWDITDRQNPRKEVATPTRRRTPADARPSAACVRTAPSPSYRVCLNDEAISRGKSHLVGTTHLSWIGDVRAFKSRFGPCHLDRSPKVARRGRHTSRHRVGHSSVAAWYQGDRGGPADEWTRCR
jgi:hypothetical protein